MAASRALAAARDQDRTGQLDMALSTYASAVRLAETDHDRPVLIEALRRLAVLNHRRNNSELALELCRRSLHLAEDMGDEVQVGEAQNTLGGFDFEAGEMAAARQHLQQAMRHVARSPELCGRVEQNLGSIASVRGDHAEADAHYFRSLESFESSGDQRGSAIAWHNLGLSARALGDWDVAVERLTRGAELAAIAGDVRLEALCQIGLAEISHGRKRYDEAQHQLEAALITLERLDIPVDLSAAHRIMGMIFRETGRVRDAAHQFRTAVQLAVETRWVLGEAEALRELARLNQEAGLKNEALTLFTVAHGLFAHVEARTELAEVANRMKQLAA